MKIINVCKERRRNGGICTNQASLREGGGPRQRWKENAQLQFSTNFTKWISMKSYTLSLGKIFPNEPAPLFFHIKNAENLEIIYWIVI